MIWTIENEKYLVTLPDINAIQWIKDTVKGKEVLVVSTQNSATYICSAAEDKHEKGGPFRLYIDLLCHSSENPLDQYTMIQDSELQTKKFQIYPMLIPLDKDGHPVNEALRADLPDGTLIEIGHLMDYEVEMYLESNSLYGDVRLEDEGKGQVLAWIAYNGCLISRYGLFRDTAEAAWKTLYMEQQ